MGRLFFQDLQQTIVVKLSEEIKRKPLYMKWSLLSKLLHGEMFHWDNSNMLLIKKDFCNFRYSEI